jgi:AbrB family looped-hinge helix DNA binding protein
MGAETKMSGKGQVVIPKEVRDALQWSAGTELEVVRRAGTVVLKRKLQTGVVPTDIAIKRAQAALNYKGPRLDEADWDAAIDRMIRKKWASER